MSKKIYYFIPFLLGVSVAFANSLDAQLTLGQKQQLESPSNNVVIDNQGVKGTSPPTKISISSSYYSFAVRLQNQYSKKTTDTAHAQVTCTSTKTLKPVLGNDYFFSISPITITTNTSTKLVFIRQLGNPGSNQLLGSFLIAGGTTITCTSLPLTDA